MKKLYSWQIGGLVFTLLVGSLLHFLYDWTNSPVVAVFSAVNESTWEHLKLLFFPAFVFSVVESKFLLKHYPNFWQTKLIGIVAGLVLIPALFYTYNGAFGKSPDWLNIVFFLVVVVFVFYIETQLFKENPSTRFRRIFAIISLCVIAVLFGVFTFLPPKLPLFIDPITNTYGI